MSGVVLIRLIVGCGGIRNLFNGIIKSIKLLIEYFEFLQLEVLRVDILKYGLRVLVVIYFDLVNNEVFRIQIICDDSDLWNFRVFGME